MANEKATDMVARCFLWRGAPAPCRGIIRAEGRQRLLGLGSRFLPPVGESSVLSYRGLIEGDGDLFLPPVGESSVLSLLEIALKQGLKFLPPVGESSVLR